MGRHTLRVIILFLFALAFVGVGADCTTDADCPSNLVCKEGSCYFGGKGCCLHMGADDHCEYLNHWNCNTGWFILSS
ncbi:MAG: hypothetical protein QF415_15155, partial [Candidatus Undinarchaeales archaeon]|nr:hypothetical protein [Candidatus Undinarchaeales archaeon]